jgi:hypothetical protein
MTATFFTINISFKKITTFPEGVILLLFQATYNQNWKGYSFFRNTRLVLASPSVFHFKKQFRQRLKGQAITAPVSLLLGK